MYPCTLFAEAGDPDCPADASPIDDNLLCSSVTDQSECSKKFAILHETTALMCSWLGSSCMSTGGESKGFCKPPPKKWVECKDKFWKGALNKEFKYFPGNCQPRINAGKGDPGYHNQGWCGDNNSPEECRRWCDEDEKCHAYATNGGRCRRFIEATGGTTCEGYSFGGGAGRIVYLRVDRIGGVAPDPWVECKDKFWKGALNKKFKYFPGNCQPRINAGKGDPGYHNQGWCGDNNSPEECRRWCDEDEKCHAYATNGGRCRRFIEATGGKTCEGYGFGGGAGRIVYLRTDRIR